VQAPKLPILATSRQHRRFPKEYCVTRDEIYAKVRDVLVDAMAVDEEDVTPEASLTRDLGAESIDFLDIVFRLEQAFGFKIAQGELFPENVQQDPDFVQDGRITTKGIEALRQRLPHADFAVLEKDPQINKVAEIFTVEALVRFVERKLAAK
jgi:acyl carrier protein